MTEREPTELERAVARAIAAPAFEHLNICGRVDLQDLFLPIARAAIAECFRRRPMETAPKDETWIFLLSVNGTWHVGKWDAEGTSWVDEAGEPSDEAHDLAVTGVWASADGWFQPNEVAGWMPIPPPSQDEP